MPSVVDSEPVGLWFDSSGRGVVESLAKCKWTLLVLLTVLSADSVLACMILTV